MGVFELDVEEYGRREIRTAGGLMLKWVSPGSRGVPDDIAFWPGPIIDFIEFKTEEKYSRLNPRQFFVHERLRHFGVHVIVLESRVAVDAYIRDRLEAVAASRH